MSADNTIEHAPESDSLVPMGEHTPGFDTVIRGYDREQVERHIAWLEGLVGQAEHDSAEARESVEEARAEAMAARQDATAARMELERGRPSYDALGKRIGQMLTLAEEEATELRSAGERDAERVRASSLAEHAQIERRRDEILQRAQQEAGAVVAAARQEAEKTVTASREQAAATEAHSKARVAELAQQQDKIREHLGRLQQQLAAAMGNPEQ